MRFVETLVRPSRQIALIEHARDQHHRGHEELLVSGLYLFERMAEINIEDASWHAAADQRGDERRVDAEHMDAGGVDRFAARLPNDDARRVERLANHRAAKLFLLACCQLLSRTACMDDRRGVVAAGEHDEPSVGPEQVDDHVQTIVDSVGPFEGSTDALDETSERLPERGGVGRKPAGEPAIFDRRGKRSSFGHRRPRYSQD